MATDRQIAANRSNGSLGRGPKTSAGKARSSRNALKHGLSIPIKRDKTLRRQIELLARVLAQSEAGNVFGQARAAAEAELELARAELYWRRYLRAQGLVPSGMVDRNKALRWFTSSPSCRGSNAMSVGHSPSEGARYGISELALLTRKSHVLLLEVEFGFVLPFNDAPIATQVS
jgi:hypothetical protein